MDNRESTVVGATEGIPISGKVSKSFQRGKLLSKSDEKDMQNKHPCHGRTSNVKILHRGHSPTDCILDDTHLPP